MNYQKILLIDDDADDQEIFLTALKRIPSAVECIAISDAKVALQQLGGGQIKPDVIFLDLNMPVMNGQQFLQEIKKRGDLKHIPVVIFSTSSHKPTIELTKNMGAMDFITKPDKFNDLISILNSFFS